MKIRIFFFFLTYSFLSSPLSAQISYGGSPLFPQNTTLRSAENPEFIEMPSFDLDSILRLDELNKENMRGSYQFAHKFYTKIEKGKDGNNYTLTDGTKIWQVGIRSENAYSINLLFSKFEIPPGGKLFVYNADHSHIIGAFDHRNNSSDKILPIRPINGDAILIEYSEPANAEYEGKLVIGEVNHDYRGILRKEPAIDSGTSYLCMPDVLCEDVDETLTRSTVLLIIDGITSCSGTLINNAENDETPYLLTAVHCLFAANTLRFPQQPEFYIKQAGSTIVFFNYNRPVCGTKMKGTEEMSVAIAHPRVIIEKKDIALLELQEKPPHYYNAYYAGWNIDTKADQPPYTNLHHPSGTVKKYGVFNSDCSIASWNDPKLFEPNSHWRVSNWNTGSTHSGSSGSPLFDSNNLLIGGLTGGDSSCRNNQPSGQGDFFFALYSGWEQIDENNQLKTYLDPNDTGITQLEGLDPFKENPFYRISNVNPIESDHLVTTEYPSPNNGLVFGNSNLQVLEFAEEFNLEYPSYLHGVYLFIPQINHSYTSNVEISIYSGENSPEKLIASKIFRPQYLDYRNSSFIPTNKNMISVPTESFVTFDELVKVGKKFFVAYKVPYSTDKKFAVYNIISETGKNPNSAWIKNEENTWVPADLHKTYPVSTSLAIQPLLRYKEENSLPFIEKERKDKLQYLREEQRLIFPEKVSSSGEVLIYSISGQLVEKKRIEKGTESIILQKMSAGTVGIAHFFHEDKVYSGKFIY